MKFFQTEAEIKRIAQQAVEDYKNEEYVKQRPYTNDEELMRNTIAVSFNFNDAQLTAFSVERQHMNDAANEQTVICYYLPPNKNEPSSTTSFIRHWYAHCSREQHNKLVQAFENLKTPASKTKQLLKG